MLIGWGIGEKLKLSKALANLSPEVLQVMVQTFYMVCRTKPVAFSPHHPSSSVYLTWLVCIRAPRPDGFPNPCSEECSGFLVITHKWSITTMIKNTVGCSFLAILPTISGWELSCWWYKAVPFWKNATQVKYDLKMEELRLLNVS